MYITYIFYILFLYKIQDDPILTLTLDTTENQNSLTPKCGSAQSRLKVIPIDPLQFAKLFCVSVLLLF